MESNIGQIADDVRKQTDRVKEVLDGEVSEVSLGFSFRQDLNRHELYLEIGVMDPTNGTEMRLLERDLYSTKQYECSTVATVAAVATNTVRDELPGIQMLEYSLHEYCLPR